MTSTEPTQIHQRSAPSRRCLPHRTKGVSEIPWNSNISLIIHPATIFSHSNTQRTSEDRCRIQLECHISSRIWQAQVIGMWGHNTEVLQHEETSNNPSWCVWQETRSRTHPGWWSSHLHIQSTHTHRAALCQQWEGTTCCIFSAECFRTYVFGRHFTIKSDHKSLEQISMKNLADAPVRLQRMLLRLKDYDFTIKYCPGEEMVIADTLSRYSLEDTPEILLDISVNHIYIDAEKKWDYQLAIKDDPLLSALADTIIAGWPDDIKDVPKALWPYHGQCDSLTVEDGLILHEKQSSFPQERGRRSWNKSIKDTLAHPSANTGLDMHILAWHQQGHWTTGRSMCHLSETSTSGAKAATEANTTTWTTLATTWSWLYDVWWK